MLGCPVTWAVYTIAGKDALKTTTPITGFGMGILIRLCYASVICRNRNVSGFCPGQSVDRSMLTWASLEPYWPLYGIMKE